MCGIAGFFSEEWNASEHELRAMTDSLAHRGPDSEGFFLENNCGLGHRRLSIIDLSELGNQPMISNNERFVMIFNGEVFNFQEILGEVKAPLKSHSDTEVVLELFAQSGIQSLQSFNGMFAFAVYDRIEKKLFLIRDRIGVKPLFYFYDGSNLAFASELKALLRLPQISSTRKINPAAINQFLHLGYIPHPGTAFENIYKLPAGSVLEFHQGKISISKYWNARSVVAEKIIRDESEARKNLHQLLRDSIRLRMIADVPYGTFLSGGTDSSLITAIAQEHVSSPVKTFCIGLKESDFNEAQFAKKVATHLGTDHHEFIVSSQDALDLVDRYVGAYDEPFADPSGIPTMLVSKLARQHVTMTLSGDGGDELFLGYGMHVWAQRMNNPLLWNFRYPIASMLSAGENRFRRAAELFRIPSRKNLPAHIFSQEQYFFSEREIQKLLHPEKQKEISLVASYSALSRRLSPMESQALFDLEYYLPDDLLVKVDRASMQFSLECRTPFLDYRVVEYALNLEQSLRYRNGISKWIVKEILYEYLPKKLMDRPKRGFAIPLKHWLKNELRPLLEQQLSADAIQQSNWLNPEEVEKLKKRFFAGEDFLYNRLWSLIVLQKFLMNNPSNG